eukprot:s1634_g8.t1
MSASLHEIYMCQHPHEFSCATELAFAMEPENKRRKLVEAQGAAGLPARSHAESVNTLQLNVSLPSGRSAALSLPLDGTVLDLKIAAQQSLGQAFLRLAAPNGRLLNPTEPLQDSGLQDGDSITAVVQKLKAAATWATFESNRTSSRFRAARWRQHHSCCTEAQSSCNR